MNLCSPAAVARDAGELSFTSMLHFQLSPGARRLGCVAARSSLRTPTTTSRYSQDLDSGGYTATD